MGTANHYLLDCVAGGAVVLLGRLLTVPVQRLAARAGRRLRREAPTPVPDYTVASAQSEQPPRIGAQRRPAD
jgi:hypothetical protein